jgi:HAD superfamily hydrolase (TIGR01509 family)
MAAFNGAIFDMDGTLLNSMHMWDSVASNYLKSLGITPKPDFDEKVKSKTGRQVARIFRREYGVRRSASEIIDGFNGILTDFYVNKAQLKDGVSGMLETLRRRGVKMCLATATDRHLVEPALRRTGIYDYFGRIFTCTEAGAGKELPDIFWQALRFLGTDIRETVLFEDAFYAVRTAKAAGFAVAAVFDPSPHHPPDESRLIADYYIESFADWDAEGFEP